MQYLLFPLFLVLLYSTTFIPKTPPPTEAGAPQTKPADNQPTGQPAIVKEISPLMAPSEYVEKKEEVKEVASKQEKGTHQGEKSDVEMVAPSEPVEKKEEAKEATSEIVQQNKEEEKEDPNIAMAAPSEPVINEAAAPAAQTKPEEGPTEKPQATEENSPMMAPSEPVEVAKEEAVPEHKVETEIAMAAPSEAAEKKEPAESSETKPEIKNETTVEAKAIEETPPQNKVEAVSIENTVVTPAVEEKPVVAAVEKPEAEEEAEPSKQEELKIIAVKVKKLGKLTRAEIITSGELLHYNIFSLDSPDRVVVDVKGATGIATKKRIKVVSTNIKKVRLGQHDKFARIVFDCRRKPLPYEVVNGRNSIILFFGKKAESKAEPEKKLTATETSR